MSKPNFASQTIWTGDNLTVMRGINDGCVDLIYLDPPFNSNRDYGAPIGSKAAGAAFKDTWTLSDVDVHEHGELADRNPGAYSVIEAARQAHGKGMQSYLIMMAVRLIEMQRILKNTGSIYLHCDPTASHYLKLLMDSIFGKTCFRNEIVWFKGYRGTARKNRWQQEHDTILMYSNGGKQIWNSPRGEYKDKSMSRYNKTDEDGNRYALIKRRRTDGTVYYGKTYPKGKLAGDVIELPLMASTDPERTGYPTQKPLALLDRIIQASSNKGDMVLDPFCGCATTLVAADRLGREWAGIDLSPLAIKLVNDRLAEELGLFGTATALDKPPQRTDIKKLPSYRTHRHRLYGEQEGVCAGCDTHFPFRVMDVDHMLPISRGGTDHADNLQLLCSGCNRSKGNKTMAEWKAGE